MDLSYSNDNDKCYGATGMAMAVVIFDGEDKLASVDIDTTPDRIVAMTDEFYFSGNPGMSAKGVWNVLLKNFNITMAMSLGNVMCRRMVLNGSSIDRETYNQLRQLMVEAGTENCSLEADETTRLFDRNFTYLQRVFNHQGVQEVAREFARVLTTRRRLSRLEVIEQLRALSSL